MMRTISERPARRYDTKRATSNAARPLLAIAAWSALVIACSPAPRYAFDDSVAAAGVELGAVPSAWRGGSAERADIVIRAAVSWSGYETAADGTEAGSAGGARKIIAADHYALTADWLDSRESVSAASLGLEEAIAAAVPLGDVGLPLKVLAYDGVFPGEPGYALTRRVLLEARIAGKDLRGRLRAEAEAFIASLERAPDPAGLAWLGAVGDVMPGAGSSALLLEPDGPRLAFRRLLPVMQSQDILIANLETAVTDRGTPWPKTFRFRMPKSALRPLRASGIDLVGLANNHVYDYTAVGFEDTLAALEGEGLPYIGAGRDWSSALRPYVGALGGSTIKAWALAAFPVERTGFNGLRHASIQRGLPGLLWADERALDAVGEALSAPRSPGELRVVSVHAGREYIDEPSELQTGLYRRLVDLGADIVLGHHPHVLQPMEWYQGTERSGLIVYSLGNFIFDGIEDNPEGFYTVLLSIGWSGGRIRALRAYPARLDGLSVDLDDESSETDRIWSLSREWAERQD